MDNFYQIWIIFIKFLLSFFFKNVHVFNIEISCMYDMSTCITKK